MITGQGRLKYKEKSNIDYQYNIKKNKKCTKIKSHNSFTKLITLHSNNTSIQREKYHLFLKQIIGT